MVRRSYRRTIRSEVLGTDFWLADYSRLVWRTRFMEDRRESRATAGGWCGTGL